MNETVIDHNKILQQIALVYFLRTLKLVFTILQFSYYTGIFWFILCDWAREEGYVNHEMPSFLDHFSLNIRSSLEVAIIVMYYAFTTLSTVGFGDYYPSSELEKILSVPIMMFGVSVFSYVMGSF